MAEVGVIFSSEWKTRLDNDLYKNWLKVGYGMYLTCCGIKSYVDREAKTFHGSLIALCMAACTCIYTPSRRTNPHHDMKACYWAKTLEHRHTRRKPTWSHSDGSKWIDPNVGYWEVAKLFMPFGCANGKVSAKETDPTGILNLLQFCNYFKTNTALVKNVKDTRNMWAHADKQELTEVQKQDAFLSMKAFLKDPELVADVDAQDALSKLDKLEKEAMIDYETVEDKVASCLKDFVATIKDELDEKLTSVKDQEEANAQEVKEEISTVKDMLNFCLMTDKKRDSMLADMLNQMEKLSLRIEESIPPPPKKKPSNILVVVKHCMRASLTLFSSLFLKLFKVFFNRYMILAIMFCLLPYLEEPGNELERNRAAYADRRDCPTPGPPTCRRCTNGRWKRVTMDMIELSFHNIGVSLSHTNGSDGGLQISGDVYNYGCGRGAGSGAVTYFKGDWTQIRYTQEFRGSASCWKIFGGPAYPKFRKYFAFSGNSLLQVPTNEVQDYSASAGDVIFNELYMHNNTYNKFDGRVYRCDNEKDNFWHNINGQGMRIATVMLRRDVMEGKAGIMTETSCGTPKYLINDIWVYFINDANN